MNDGAAEQVSAAVADWTRERVVPLSWTPSRRLVRAVRAYQHWQGRGAWAWPLKRWAALRARVWNVVCGSEVPVALRAGGGLILPHPNGVVIHPKVELGVNCMVFQQVTLGTVGPRPGVPRVGGHVDIGAGAKVLGPVTIGDHAKIGANAVVTCDVPAGATAVGVPARVRLPGAPPAAGA